MSAPSGPTVLVADDNPDQRALYVDILTHAGYVVIEARDGAEAIERAREDRPALILMDVTMPGTSGWNAVRAVRDQVETREHPGDRDHRPVRRPATATPRSRRGATHI